jgi:hypothetical protein
MSRSDRAHLEALARTLHDCADHAADAGADHGTAHPYGPGAPAFLLEAADTIGTRAAERDRKGGERSMALAVRMFNEWRVGTCVNGSGALTEREGWMFMAILKMARMQGGRYRRDDHVDGAAYIALAGECEEARHHHPMQT